MEKLKKSLNSKTKLLILNTPHNPTGKILTYTELEQIAHILKAFPRVLVVSDEVYEYMIYDDFKTLPRMSAIPGMWDRTITVHSAGKFLSATGLRIGWSIAPKNIINSLHAIHQYSTFCMNGPLQNAVAESLEIANNPYKGHENYYQWLRQHYQDSRDYFIENLEKIDDFKGKFWKPEGSYFVLVDISKDKIPEHNYVLDGDDGSNYTKDFKYVLNLAHTKKVSVIPISLFYTEQHKHLGENLVRLAFCKKKETMDKAFDNLKRKC